MEKEEMVLAAVLGWLVGFGVIVYSVVCIFRGLETWGWKETVGTVLSREVKMVQHPKTFAYAPRVLYSYEVDGVVYESDVVQEGIEISLEAATNMSLEYSPDSKIKVFHSTSNPSKAVLQRGMAGDGWRKFSFLFVIGVFFLGIGTSCFLKSRSRSDAKTVREQRMPRAP